GCGVEGCRVPLRARAAGHLLPNDRRSAGAPERLGRRGADAQPLRPGVLAAAAAGALDPEDSRVGAHRRQDHAVRRGSDPRRHDRRAGARRPRPRCRRAAGETALAAAAACRRDGEQRLMTRRVPPAYWFLAPALAVIVVFFCVPIAASVVLSLTD